MEHCAWTWTCSSVWLITLNNHLYSHEDDMKHFCSLPTFSSSLHPLWYHKAFIRAEAEIFHYTTCWKGHSLWNSTSNLAITSKRVTLLFILWTLPHGMWPAIWPLSILKMSTCTPFFFSPRPLTRFQMSRKYLSPFDLPVVSLFLINAQLLTI